MKLYKFQDTNLQKPYPKYVAYKVLDKIFSETVLEISPPRDIEQRITAKQNIRNRLK